MRHKEHLAYSFLLILLLVIPATEIRGNPSDLNQEVDFSELTKLVPAELKEKNAPGAVIAIVSGDRVIYEKAFGVAKR